MKPKTPCAFHDGSAATLEDAVAVMAGGGIENPNLSSQFKAIGSENLTDENKADLVAFLPDRLSAMPKVVYFHENQLTYPYREESERDYQFAFHIADGGRGVKTTASAVVQVRTSPPTSSLTRVSPASETSSPQAISL